MAERWNVEARDLRHRVTIEKKTVTTNSRGNSEATWNTYLRDIAANVYSPNGRKLELARQMVPTATHIIEIRFRRVLVEYDEDLDPPQPPAQQYRVNYKGRIFGIGFINDMEERHVKLELVCTEEWKFNG